jgi:hypothetical protein
MTSLRDDLWGAWHLKDNRLKVLRRLEMITRIEKKRLSAVTRVVEGRGSEQQRAQASKMLKHWAQELDWCAYELLGIANGLQGKKMP